MKGKDAFLKLKEQGKIDNPEYEKFIGSIPDFEFPDTAFQAFEERFLTVDRAKADPTIQSHYKAQTLNGVDAWINEGVQNQMWESSVLEEKDTFKRLKLIKESIKNNIERLKSKPGTDPDKEKKLTEYENTVQSLTSKVSSLTSEYEQSKSKMESEYKKKLDQMELDYAIRQEIDQYTYADEHMSSPEKKRVLKRLILEEIKTNNHFSLKDGQIKVWLDETHTGPKFERNTELTFKPLLDKVVEPYLKKNNGSTGTTSQKTHTPAPVTEKSTLKQMRQGLSTVTNGTI